MSIYIPLWLILAAGLLLMGLGYLLGLVVLDQTRSTVGFAAGMVLAGMMLLGGLALFIALARAMGVGPG